MEAKQLQATLLVMLIAIVLMLLVRSCIFYFQIQFF